MNNFTFDAEGLTICELVIMDPISVLILLIATVYSQALWFQLELFIKILFWGVLGTRIRILVRAG